MACKRSTKLLDIINYIQTSMRSYTTLVQLEYNNGKRIKGNQSEDLILSDKKRIPMWFLVDKYRTTTHFHVIGRDYSGPSYSSAV